ncbi:hypothetical protein TIFTF001_037209 [Ficus carica]|uniref:Uncharacterized protein n=1 Tax=Ficus carica TaxID=3494 RepID=A0AA88E5U6_FICCA|nr:hypothetical protein TIFTF001_037186 [Ficus carica]GMN68133.1 hypothetical protein TIFTF001_037195 [Ficus carica]GMN68144.1 hypothetical protein TIFTF001_037200 [Ficus carica]GMN68147.1 hypothetical protein TIFTF001_037209 [Ficus carica]
MDYQPFLLDEERVLPSQQRGQTPFAILRSTMQSKSTLDFLPYGLNRRSKDHHSSPSAWRSEPIELPHRPPTVQCPMTHLQYRDSP